MGCTFMGHGVFIACPLFSFLPEARARDQQCVMEPWRQRAGGHEGDGGIQAPEVWRDMPVPTQHPSAQAPGVGRRRRSP